MKKVATLAAQARARAGKGTARQNRRDGLVPAVIYGSKKSPNMIALETNSFLNLIRKPGFFTHLLDITVEGQTERCLPRDIQFDPVTDKPLHVDFLRVDEHSTITVQVPVEFINADKAPGVKGGGVLNIVRHTIEMECRATHIPEKITVDLTGLEVGDSLHISDLTLPADARPVLTEDFTVATIVAPSALKAEEEAPVTAAAPAAGAEGAAAAPAAGAAPGATPAAGAAPAAAGAKAPAAGAKAPAGGK